MVRYDQQCPSCGWAGEVIVEAGAEVTCPQCGTLTERVWQGELRVADDTLPGGPRWIENLDHHPVWVETKTDLERELAARGARLKESPNRNRHDRSPWASQTRLTASASDDPHLQQVAAEVAAVREAKPVVPGPAPLGDTDRLVRLEWPEVALIVETEKILHTMGIYLILECQDCSLEGPARLVASNRRGSNTWSMRCPHREYRYGPEGAA